MNLFLTSRNLSLSPMSQWVMPIFSSKIRRERTTTNTSHHLTSPLFSQCKDPNAHQSKQAKETIFRFSKTHFQKNLHSSKVSRIIIMPFSLQLNSYNLSSLKGPSYNFSHATKSPLASIKPTPSRHAALSRGKIIRAISTVPESQSEAKEPEEPPAVNFAFVHSVLLPDGTPDVHFRTACGGQKLRDIMLDSNIELYGPYAKPLSNCAGGGTCGTCMVEVIEGKQLLSPRTDNEKEKLKRKPKNWRLACQTTVGTPESRGLVVIQQLPEWKGHEWGYEKVSPDEFPQED